MKIYEKPKSGKICERLAQKVIEKIPPNELIEDTLLESIERIKRQKNKTGNNTI